MNKNIIGIILIILALAAVYFYGWPKLQPYLNTGEPNCKYGSMISCCRFSL